jgi:hypothetical protein
MPVVLRVGGFAFVVYTNDHRPPHVHVMYAGGEMVVLLGQGPQRPVVREVARMRVADARQAFRLVEQHRGELLEHWRKYHGD